MAYFVEGLAAPESVIRDHALEACPLARGERQPRSPLCPAVAGKEPVDAGHKNTDEEEAGEFMNEAHPAHHPRALAVRDQIRIVHVGSGDCEHHQGDDESPMGQPHGQLPYVDRYDALGISCQRAAGGCRD